MEWGTRGQFMKEGTYANSWLTVRQKSTQHCNYPPIKKKQVSKLSTMPSGWVRGSLYGLSEHHPLPPANLSLSPPEILCLIYMFVIPCHEYLEGRKQVLLISLLTATSPTPNQNRYSITTYLSISVCLFYFLEYQGNLHVCRWHSVPIST